MGRLFDGWLTGKHRPPHHLTKRGFWEREKAWRMTRGAKQDRRKTKQPSPAKQQWSVSLDNAEEFWTKLQSRIRCAGWHTLRGDWQTLVSNGTRDTEAQPVLLISWEQLCLFKAVSDLREFLHKPEGCRGHFTGWGRNARIWLQAVQCLTPLAGGRAYGSQAELSLQAGNRDATPRAKPHPQSNKSVRVIAHHFILGHKMKWIVRESQKVKLYRERVRGNDSVCEHWCVLLESFSSRPAGLREGEGTQPSLPRSSFAPKFLLSPGGDVSEHAQKHACHMWNGVACSRLFLSTWQRDVCLALCSPSCPPCHSCCTCLPRNDGHCWAGRGLDPSCWLSRSLDY